mmetsp:Transcript_50768/g.62203  ORF Transcript_50768/g.62203 Transcript_50768/m.62203 type:complete len:149 (+) Transcript_50768:1-447(+)
MTTTEYITHFSLWCIGKAPLLIGCDITKMSNDTKMILMNEEAIAINQDKLGKQSTLKKSENNNNQQVYSSDLMDNAVAVLLLNRDESPVNISFTWNDLGLNSNQEYIIRDLWLKKDIAITSMNYTYHVDGHGVGFFKFRPFKGSIFWN